MDHKIELQQFQVWFGLVHELFSQKARAFPQAIALVQGKDTATYSELNDLSNRLAKYLVGLGVGAGGMVALLSHRSIDTITAIIAILKTGAAYVPLDPAYPAHQLEFMASDAAPQLVLADKQSLTALPDIRLGNSKIVQLDAALTAATVLSAEPLEINVTAADAAYVMYTSGSTGRPKGVVVPHRAIVRLVQDQSFASFGPDEVFLHMSPLAFDASTFEIWGALLHGGRLVILSDTHPSLDAIEQSIAQNHVTTLWLTAGLFHLMVEKRLSALAPLRQLLAGGDTLSPTHTKKALAGLPNTQLINGYGPTENTTFTCCHRFSPSGWGEGSAPIGIPIAHTQAYILDEALRPVADGDIGQLCAGGAGVAIGYLNRPELTAEKFVPDPFSQEHGARLYLTGDLARRRTDGNIEFLGRNDRQIKINGKRIELEEIENTLRSDEEVSDALVIVEETAANTKRIVAYVTPKNTAVLAEAAFFEQKVLQNARTTLPEHMIPAHIISLPQFPLNANGKVDRKALPTSASRRQARQVQTPFGSAMEQEIADIWGRILGIGAVTRNDNFFDLGGTSLQLVAIHAELQVKFPKIKLVDLFEHTKVGALAAFLTGGLSTKPSINDGRKSGLRQAQAMKNLRGQKIGMRNP